MPQPEELQQRTALGKPASASVPDAAPVARELGKPSDEITVDVSAYAYAVDESAPAALRATVPALTASFVGKGRSYEDLINAASAVTRFLQRELGFFLGNTYLPEQAPNGGIVRIAVLEGRLDEVILNWPERIAVDRSVGEAYLARLTPGEILRMPSSWSTTSLPDGALRDQGRAHAGHGVARRHGTTRSPTRRPRQGRLARLARLALLRRAARPCPGHRQQPVRPR